MCFETGRENTLSTTGHFRGNAREADLNCASVLNNAGYKDSTPVQVAYLLYQLLRIHLL